MTSDSDTVEPAFPSTTYEWKKVKIRRPPEGQSTVRRRRSGFLSLPRADRSREVTLRITYTGKGSSWYVIKGRGRWERFPGHLTLDDVMARVYSEH